VDHGKTSLAATVARFATPPAPASVPVVKGLDWKPGGGDGVMSIRADAIGLRYYIFRSSDDGLWHAYTEGFHHENFGCHQTIEAAKEAVRIGHERRILSALSDAPAREGWKLVPKEATEVMIDAGVAAEWGGTLGSRVANCYRAMLAASPTGEDA